jgi:hypothetical protein
MSDEPVLPRNPNAKHAATDGNRTSLILVCVRMAVMGTYRDAL